MQESKPKNIIENEDTNESISTFKKIKNGDTSRFVCSLGDKEIGTISVTLIDKDIYNIGGLFVDPTERGKGISSNLVKMVNTFLEENKSLGKLVNTIQGEAAKVYENNGWIKGDFKSQGAYGAYEYTYDGRK